MIKAARLINQSKCWPFKLRKYRTKRSEYTKSMEDADRRHGFWTKENIRLLPASWKRQQLICQHMSTKLLANQALGFPFTYFALVSILFRSHYCEHPVFLQFVLHSHCFCFCICPCICIALAFVFALALNCIALALAFALAFAKPKKKTKKSQNCSSYASSTIFILCSTPPDLTPLIAGTP